MRLPGPGDDVDSKLTLAVIYDGTSMFYDSTLEACADRSVTESLVDWEPLPQRRGSQFPMLFYGVDGRDEHEMDSPSFWNRDEAEQVRANEQPVLLPWALVKVPGRRRTISRRQPGVPRFFNRVEPCW